MPRADAPRTETVTVAGHINEASDVFAEDYPMPPVEEGDIVALLNAGGYHQAMSSTHCLRPWPRRSSCDSLAGVAVVVDPDWSPGRRRSG